MQYIRQYNSLKVLKVLFDECSHQAHYMSLFNHGNFIDLNKSADEILLLMRINCEREYVKEVCRNNVSIYDVREINKNGYIKVIEYLIENYNKLPQDQKEYYFGAKTVLEPKKAWLAAYPYFLDIAYKTNKKVFSELFKKIIDTNNDYEKENQALRKWAGNYYDAHFRQWIEHHCYIYVLQSTVVQALNNGEKDLANQLNVYCKNPLSTYQIHAIEIDNDNKLSEKEKQVAKAIHDGIVCIDELLAINDFELIKKALDRYPVHIIEKLCQMYRDDDRRGLLEYAVDNGDNTLANAIAHGDNESIRKSLLPYCGGSKSDKTSNHNNKYLYINRNGMRRGVLPDSNITSCENYTKYFDDIIDQLNEAKQRIIDDLSLRLDKEKTVGELTKEYFEKELSLGNIDMVIIKLCVRLEAILRSDYHYEGDFSEMLTRYCNTFNIYDDEANDYDPYTPKMLQKLRMQRNGIVHSEKSKECLSVNDIKWCIDCICKMG